jgi:hypothetical protein
MATPEMVEFIAVLADRSGANLENARLSDLGLRICELIETYNAEIPNLSSPGR